MTDFFYEKILWFYFIPYVRRLGISSEQYRKVYNIISLESDYLKLSEITKEILADDDIQKIESESTGVIEIVSSDSELGLLKKTKI